MYGGLGSLLGALIGEAFLTLGAAARAKAMQVSAPNGQATAEAQRGQAQAQPAEEQDTIFGKMPISQKRKEELRGLVEVGEIEIGLVWSNHNDLDLHCIDPSGEEIYFKNKTSKSQGVLDLDANSGEPYRDDPAEHIRWKQGAAPSGHYSVLVRYFSNHGGVDPTTFNVAIRAPGLGGIKNFDGSLPKSDSAKLIYEFDVPPRADPAAASAVAPGVRTAADSIVESLSPAAVIALYAGLYAAMIAVFLSVSLVVGQNRYQRLPLLTPRQGLIAVFGGCLAGMVAGAATQGIFAVIDQGPILRQVGRVAGWIVLGMILGYGMGMFIPNLPGKRAAAAGALGGGLGALALLVLGSGGFGRIAGAAILGLCIGLMIALVEELAREAWLVVNWGPNERTNINLGSRPVLIGSGPKAQIHLPKGRGYPEEWATISLDGGKIRYEEKATGRKQDLRNGSELKIEKMTIEVRSVK
jgi:hypothetical protein